MGYVIKQNELLNISGIITAAEVNNLGSTPYAFTTPANFAPIGFNITAISGLTQPTFTSDLIVCDSTFRVIFSGYDPAAIFLYNFYGYNVATLGIISQALNIDIVTENNFLITPSDSVDPTPGDYIYKFNFYGLIV